MSSLTAAQAAFVAQVLRNPANATFLAASYRARWPSLQIVG